MLFHMLLCFIPNGHIGALPLEVCVERKEEIHEYLYPLMRTSGLGHIRSSF